MRAIASLATTAVLILATACASRIVEPSSVPEELVSTELGRIDFSAEPRVTPDLVSQRLTGGQYSPPMRLEYLRADGRRIRVLMLGDYQALCDGRSVRSNYLVFEDDVLVGQATRLPRLHVDRPYLPTHSFANGGPRRIRRDATANDIAADLPMLDALPASVAEFEAAVAPIRGPSVLVCFEPADGERATHHDQVPLAPWSPFRPLVAAESASRVRAQQLGGRLYAELQLGAQLDATAFANSHRGMARAHASADGNYFVITLDLGGTPLRGRIRQGRDIGFVGVRNGIVEWKAWKDADDSELASSMCETPEGLRGEVRPGCTETGFYFP